jgi:hypothetical protein
MKPLYKPWFAASALDALANSGVKPKTLSPNGFSQKNISSTRKYRCNSATNATPIFATVFTD